MDTRDIDKILRADVKAKHFFKGVFARDELIMFLKSSAFYKSPRLALVFNTQKSSLPGEHWIALVKDGSTGYFFDSYGQHPNAYQDVCKVLIHQFERVVWNNNQLQGLTSTVCGDYCVLFILLYARGWTFEKFINRLLMSSNCETRDHSVRATLVHLYGTNAWSSIRNKRQGLTGRHKLHVENAIELILNSVLSI
jgi:hypothetical protein